MRRSSTYALTALTGISLLGVVTGCAATATTSGDATTDPTPTTTASATTDPTSTAAAGTSTYKDGSYTESGSYQSPAGSDSVKVTITLASDVVTAVKVTGDATDPTAKMHQSQFIGGISAIVVGKKIDSLKVSKVSGSSLTSDGFNAALAKIKTDARA